MTILQMYEARKVVIIPGYLHVKETLHFGGGYSYYTDGSLALRIDIP